MKFHFKQALEEAKYLQTPEGKAETFLRSIIDTIKTSSCVNCIDAISLKLYGEGKDKKPFGYKLYSSYRTYSRSIPLTINLCSSDLICDFHEIDLIYEIIQNKLREECFEPKDIPSGLEGNENHHFIKGFYFKIQF